MEDAVQKETRVELEKKNKQTRDRENRRSKEERKEGTNIRAFN